MLLIGPPRHKVRARENKRSSITSYIIWVWSPVCIIKDLNGRRNVGEQRRQLKTMPKSILKVPEDPLDSYPTHFKRMDSELTHFINWIRDIMFVNRGIMPSINNRLVHEGISHGNKAFLGQLAGGLNWSGDRISLKPFCLFEEISGVFRLSYKLRILSSLFHFNP